MNFLYQIQNRTLRRPALNFRFGSISDLRRLAVSQIPPFTELNQYESVELKRL